MQAYSLKDKFKQTRTSKGKKGGSQTRKPNPHLHTTRTQFQSCRTAPRPQSLALYITQPTMIPEFQRNSAQQHLQKGQVRNWALNSTNSQGPSQWWNALNLLLYVADPSKLSLSTFPPLRIAEFIVSCTHSECPPPSESKMIFIAILEAKFFIVH